MNLCKYLIIGGGMTADAAVKGIREVDERGDITVVGDDPYPPYQRPPLSKGLWTGKKSVDDLWCGTAERGAEILPGRRVLSIDTGNHEATDDAGTVYRYERLLLATGTTPNRLPFAGADIVYFRTFSDFHKLHAATDSKGPFVMFGAGFIATEIAAALALKECDVTLIFPEACVYGRMVPTSLGASLSRYYENRGVKIVAGRKASTVEIDEEGGYTVIVEDGKRVYAKGLVAGIGVAPDSVLADKAGLKTGNGIVVDECLRTSHPHVFSAGDVASFYNPALDRRIRVEHEDNALTMGRIAGRNMAGEKQPYHHLPYFYSDLFDVGYEAVGAIDSTRHEVLTDVQDPEDKGYLFYLENGRVRGVVFWNLFGKVEAGRELIAAPGPFSRADLMAWSEKCR